MVKELEYTLPDGSTAKAVYATHGTVYALTARRERFAQLCASGIEPEDAYCQCYETEIRPDTVGQIERATRRLLHDTTIVLRIQELKRPVLKKLQRKIEYNLDKALGQCQVAYDLAYANGDTKGMLAAIRMQAELGKLLSQDINVNHKHGLLDDASTAVLLAMRKQIEVQQAKGKQNPILVGSNSETVSTDPSGPASGEVIGSHPEAVPN